ncbi:hypothetical protein ACLOJK_024905 [Asimina triloba]
MDGSRMVVPMNILDRWFRKFQDRAKRNPEYLQGFFVVVIDERKKSILQNPHADKGSSCKAPSHSSATGDSSIPSGDCFHRRFAPQQKNPFVQIEYSFTDWEIVGCEEKGLPSMDEGTANHFYWMSLAIPPTDSWIGESLVVEGHKLHLFWMVAIQRAWNLLPNMKIAPLRSLSAPLCRSFSLWSMKKDPALESALSCNRRWIVNNQLKNIILRCPDHVAPVQLIQKKFKTLDLQGQALNWLKKYPCCFDVYLKDDEYYCKLTKRMMALVEEEESVKDGLEPVLVEKLAKLLMMSSNKRLNVIKLNELKRSFGLPDDYLVWILPKYPEMFRTVNWGIGKRSTMDIELVSWQPNFAISKVEASARGRNTEPRFECFLPSSWEKSWDRFLKFNETPYISPYSNGRCLEEGPMETEKRVVGVVHELLSLTLWKKASIMKLGHFQREFGFPEKLNLLLLRHLGIFYVSNKYQIYTVVLREGYHGSELTDKDPLVIVKDKFGELMQEGLHEYNQRRRVLNLEKKKKGLMVMKAEGKQRRKAGRTYEQDEEREEQGEIYKPEERKRFYRALFDEQDPQYQGGSEILKGWLMECSGFAGELWSFVKNHYHLRGVKGNYQKDNPEEAGFTHYQGGSEILNGWLMKCSCFAGELWSFVKNHYHQRCVKGNYRKDNPEEAGFTHNGSVIGREYSRLKNTFTASFGGSVTESVGNIGDRWGDILLVSKHRPSVFTDYLKDEMV